MEKNILLHRQDEEDEPIPISDGETFVGRSLIPNCRDKRIRDNHGLIRVSNDGKCVILTPRQTMYFIPRKQAKRFVLEKGSAVILRSGDRFSFLPQRFCFRINVPRGKAGVKSSLISQKILSDQCSNDDDSPETKKKVKRNLDDELVDAKSIKSSQGVDNDEEYEQQQTPGAWYKSKSNMRDLQPFVDEDMEVPIPIAGISKAKSHSSSEEDYFD